MSEPLSIEDGLPPPSDAWPPDVVAACAEFTCGDVIDNPPLFYYADTRMPIWAATFDYASDSAEADLGQELVDAVEYAPRFGILTSQTCDIGEIDFVPMKRPWVMVAPVYDMQVLDAGIVRSLKKNRFSQFLLFLPLIPASEGEVWVADLRIEVPLEKSALVGRTPIKSFSSSREQQRAVGDRIATLRSRPAWATSILSICRTLREFVRDTKKTDKPLWEEVREQIQEVGARVDDMETPTSAQFCIITAKPATEDIRRWWEDFYNYAYAKHASELNLQIGLVETLETCSVATYRSFDPVPFSATG